MRIRLFIPQSSDEIIARDVRVDHGLYVGKVERLQVRGEILALFHQLEEAANNVAIPEAERLTAQIERLGFRVELPGRAEAAIPSRLQVMNGDDIAFRLADHQSESAPV